VNHELRKAKARTYNTGPHKHITQRTAPEERLSEVATQRFLQNHSKALKVAMPCPQCDRVMTHNMGKPWDHRRTVKIRTCKFCLHRFEVPVSGPVGGVTP
jgi:hypothetical protein